MRTLAVGDIHGCHTALTVLLAQVQLRPDDQIIFLGDYIDRGPASREVIDTLSQLEQTCATVYLRGNHEIMILEAREDPVKSRQWQSYGGLATLYSYAAEYRPDWCELVPAAHWKFWERTVKFFETETHIFVHAALDAELTMDQQPDWLLFWESFDRLKPHPSGKRVICGHTSQLSGNINDLGFATCIDTGAAYGDWLTCLDVSSGQYWQADEKRNCRKGAL